MEIFVKKFVYFHIFSFFLVFNHDFFVYIDFIHVAASSTETDDVIIRSHIEYIIQTNKQTFLC